MNEQIYSPDIVHWAEMILALRSGDGAEQIAAAALTRMLTDWRTDHRALTNERDNSRELLTQVITAVFEKDNATAGGDFPLADAAHLRLLVAAQEAYDYLYRENG